MKRPKQFTRQPYKALPRKEKASYIVLWIFGQAWRLDLAAFWVYIGVESNTAQADAMKAARKDWDKVEHVAQLLYKIEEKG